MNLLIVLKIHAFKKSIHCLAVPEWKIDDKNDYCAKCDAASERMKACKLKMNISPSTWAVN